MKAWLRRHVLALLSDDIELMINQALVDSECCVTVDSDEIRVAVDRQLQRYDVAQALHRQTWGKD